MELRIKEDGSWYWGKVEITNSKVRQLFASHLIWLDDSSRGQGGYFVRLEGEMRPVIVEDVPFVAVTIWEKKGTLELVLKDGRTLFFPQADIVINGDIPYTSLWREMDTRFSRQAYWQLAQHLEQVGDSCSVNWVGRVWRVSVL